MKKKAGAQIEAHLFDSEGHAHIIERGSDLICPICSKHRAAAEYQPPFIDGTGRWLCGTCWFDQHHISVMAPRRHQAEVAA